MKLRSVQIAGYRSIRHELDFRLDDRVTVILGANDHGKSNLLEALLHLNPDHPFDREHDLNWDCHGKEDVLPALRFELELSTGERETWLALINAQIERATAADFRAQLQSEATERARRAADASKQLADIQAQLDEETQTAAQLKVSSPGSADALEAAKRVRGLEAQFRKASKRATSLDAATQSAKARAALSYAHELEVEAKLTGNEAFDLRRLRRRTQAVTARSNEQATVAESAAQEAAAVLDQTRLNHGEGSDEYRTAEAKARSMQQDARRARQEARRLAAESAQLKAALDATRLAGEGKLSYEPAGNPPSPELRGLESLPTHVTLTRAGLQGELVLEKPDDFGIDTAMQFLRTRLPRLELIRPYERLSDSVDAESIQAEDNDFMRGIFRYAGLSPDEWVGVFKQTDRTTRRLDDANQHLNATLRESWSQGQELEFRLDHRGREIDLMIKDPAVEGRYVRASRRSSGFTHFFALKTVLYAREAAADATSFIGLFDEPGIYLHPKGQHDLLQVIESLAASNQIVYTTHSVFLINKNHPTRHRLLTKDTEGTVIDSKPYAGQWRSAIDALGLAFPGSFLFASKVLLVEGDSDPILLNADLQRLIDAGKLDIDINPLAIIATGDSKHADAMIRIMLEAASPPSIALLFDGDRGGRERKRSLQRLIDWKKLPTHTLADTSVEDHVLSPNLFCEATIRFVEGALDESSRRAEVRAELAQSFSQRFASGAIAGLAAWAREEGMRALGEDDEPSPVGIAREYARLLAEASWEDLEPHVTRSLELAGRIRDLLGLTSQYAPPEIVER